MVTIPKIHRKLLRDIKTAKVQFGAVIIIIVLGVAVFIGAYGAYLNLNNSYDTSFDRLNMADYWITLDYIEQRAAREINEIPGVIAQGRIVDEVFLNMGDEHAEQVVGRVISLPPNEHPRLNDILVVSGSYFSSASGREILAEKHFADYHKLVPGDWLTIERGDSKARFKIAGVVISPEYIWVAKSAQEPWTTPRTFGVLFMSEATAEQLFNMKGIFNEISFTIEQDIVHSEVIEEVKQILHGHHIKRLTSRDDPIIIRTREIDVIHGVRTAYMIERKDQLSNKLLRMDIEGLAQMALLFPILFLTMASLSIYILLNRLVESQRIQIGIMQALGYSKAMILFHYLGFSLFAGITGSLLGAGLGHFIADNLTVVYAAQLNMPFTVVEPHWDIIVIGIIIGIAIPLIAGLFPAWSATKMRPAEAMRADTPAFGRRTFLEIILPFLSRLPYMIKLPLRNVFRNVRRSLFMAMGVASAVTLILVSLSFVDAMEKTLDTQFERIENYDAVIIFQGRGSATTASFIKHLEGVQHAEAVLEMPYRIRYEDRMSDSSVMGLPDNASLYKLPTQEGDYISVKEGGVLIPISLKEKLGVEIGDILKLEPIVGTVGETEKQLIGIVDTPFASKVFMPLREAQEMLRTPGVATSVMLTFNEQPSYNLIKRLYNLPQTASIQFAEDTRNFINELMGFFWVFIGIMLIMGVTLGVAIIFNGVTTNILQRKREIAIMRAIGLSRTRLTLILALENLVIGCMGVIIGIPLGYYISGYFMATQDTEIFSMSTVIFPRTYIIAAISAFIILLLSHIPAIKQIYRLSLATVTKDWSE